jgi:hypothetical protein
VKWNQSEHYPWHRTRWWTLSAFVILTCVLSLNRSCHTKTPDIFIASAP